MQENCRARKGREISFSASKNLTLPVKALLRASRHSGDSWLVGNIALFLLAPSEALRGMTEINAHKASNLTAAMVSVVAVIPVIRLRSIHRVVVRGTVGGTVIASSDRSLFKHDWPRRPFISLPSVVRMRGSSKLGSKATMQRDLAKKNPGKTEKRASEKKTYRK